MINSQIPSTQPSHDYRALMKVIIGGYCLPLGGYHGVAHWARVLENGLRLADACGADREVVTLFALFHDSRRENEGRDDGHGLRGAELAFSLRDDLIHLNDHRFDLLFEACRLHTMGFITGDITLQACWDADRLDLARVGVIPIANRLCTSTARTLISWATRRAANDHQPIDTLHAWGIDPNSILHDE